MSARIVRAGRPARVGAVLLLLGPLVSWVAEFITAAAWQNPHYSALYNWVSHLGLPQHETAFGQVADSPLAWVMNTGWIVYAILLIAGAVTMLDLRKGWRPLLLAILAIVSAVGVSLVAIFHGSTENVANGTAVFHFVGAQAAIVSGNVFAIIAGASGARLGFGRGWGRTLVVVGALGLVGFILFMIDARVAIPWNLGLFERWAMYPLMIGHLVTGILVLRGRSETARIAVATA